MSYKLAAYKSIPHRPVYSVHSRINDNGLLKTFIKQQLAYNLNTDERY